MTEGARSTAELKSSYDQTRRGIGQRFLDQKNPEAALTELAQAVDDLVIQVAEPFLEQSDFSLIALGGYGRREMYPYSDIDLLILFQEAQREGEGVAGSKALKRRARKNSSWCKKYITMVIKRSWIIFTL